MDKVFAENRVLSMDTSLYRISVWNTIRFCEWNTVCWWMWRWKRWVVHLRLEQIIVGTHVIRFIECKKRKKKNQLKSATVSRQSLWIKLKNEIDASSGVSFWAIIFKQLFIKCFFLIVQDLLLCLHTAHYGTVSIFVG